MAIFVGVLLCLPAATANAEKGNKARRMRSAPNPPYTRLPRQPDPASDAFDWLEGLAAAPGLLIDLICSTSKIRMTGDLKRERDRFPNGRMMFLEFEVTVDDQGAGMGPKSGCVMGWKILDSGMGWPNPQSTVQQLNDVGRRRIVWNTLGTGDDLDNLKAAVAFAITTPSPVAIRGPCATTSVSAVASIRFDGRSIPVDAASVGIEWATSDPAGLQLVTGPGLRARGSTVETQVLKATEPGNYTVSATLKRVDPDFIRNLAPDEAAADRLARDLSLIDTKLVQVHVGKEMIEPITIEPGDATLAADQKLQFSVRGLDTNLCYAVDLTTDERVSWSTDGNGTIAAGLYTPPPLEPIQLEIEWPDRPDRIGFCATADLRAKIEFDDPGSQHVFVDYESNLGEGTVRLTPPSENYIEARIQWSPGNRVEPREWDERHDPKPMTVTATYKDGPYSISGQMQIDVEPAQSFLVLRNLPTKAQVGAVAFPEAKLRFYCLRELEDVTGESTFSMTDPEGYVSDIDMKRYGITFDQEGTYKIHVETIQPGTGEILSANHQVEVTGLRATVSVGPVVPGPALAP